MLEKFDDPVFSNEIDLDDIDWYCYILSDNMGHNTTDLNNINPDDDNFDNDSETVIHVRHMAWHNRYEQRMACEKEIYKKLMPVVWYPTRMWD